MKLSKKTINIFLILLTGVAMLGSRAYFIQSQHTAIEKNTPEIHDKYWFELQRSANIENLYKGVPGEKSKSIHVKSFNVKVGIPGERPTPLPQLVGRDYWIITEKQAQLDNPETAPYFLTLDVPVSDEAPFGPVPYEECNGQCDWILPGAFGLHGTAGNPTKLSDFDLGSSGCIRHSDAEITYLYNLLEPDKEEIRYYIVE